MVEGKVNTHLVEQTAMSGLQAQELLFLKSRIFSPTALFLVLVSLAGLVTSVSLFVYLLLGTEVSYTC